jgi:hypothetical protein
MNDIQCIIHLDQISNYLAASDRVDDAARIKQIAMDIFGPAMHSRGEWSTTSAYDTSEGHEEMEDETGMTDGEPVA